MNDLDKLKLEHADKVLNTLRVAVDFGWDYCETHSHDETCTCHLEQLEELLLSYEEALRRLKQ